MTTQEFKQKLEANETIPVEAYGDLIKEAKTDGTIPSHSPLTTKDYMDVLGAFSTLYCIFKRYGFKKSLAKFESLEEITFAQHSKRIRQACSKFGEACSSIDDVIADMDDDSGDDEEVEHD